MHLSHPLTQWSNKLKHDTGKVRKIFEKRLKNLYDQDPIDDVLSEITDIQINLNLKANKEHFWKQRARVNWLQHGDKNNNFFHKMALGCQTRKKFKGLGNDARRGLLMVMSC